MYNPELLTAYIIAGTVSSVILFTAFKIVRTSSSPQQDKRHA